MTITQLHTTLAATALRKAGVILEKRGVDTAWGANGQIGELALKLLKTDEFPIQRDFMGAVKTPATSDEISIARDFVMAGLCADWPEKYGSYTNEPRARELLAA